MLTYIWMIQTVVMILILTILLLICFITDLPRVLGLSFSRKETISKYLKKYIRKDLKLKKTICNFKMIGSKTKKNIEEVYIYMYIAKYNFKSRKLVPVYEAYSKAKVTITRKFGIYKVVELIMESERSTDEVGEFYPAFITGSKDYHEYINSKVDRFLKEANFKKAKKRLILKTRKKRKI